MPSIGELLASTGEFTERTRKRYDDTDLLISSFAEAGYDSEAGRRAIRRMNRIHGRFGISNDDFLYVLSTFVFEPIRWNARFGWRPLVETEKLASFHFWREVGRRMAIRDVPESYEGLERFNVDFERERFAFSEGGRRVADATLRMFSRGVPGVRRAICAVLDEPLLEALGLPRPSAAGAPRGGGSAACALSGRAAAAAEKAAPAADVAPEAKLPFRLDDRGTRSGPVAQRTERQPSKLRAVVRLHPGPFASSR